MVSLAFSRKDREFERSSPTNSTARGSHPLVGGCDNKVIPDEAITVSSGSHLSSDSRIDGNLGWSPHASDEAPWIMWSFSEMMCVMSVRTRGGVAGHVQKYTLSYSVDNINWQDCEEDFVGNVDSDTEREVKLNINVTCKMLRLYPV
eukprot:CAMPEP_0195126142 /NCGR_PEP_ID=MMETSP0448-20130528/134336_1 /TAXON_ID=66468 /ORGANISM="Heterocapsa triquestra, Strain CCMP 448" /LENGTH=146 /DNA_ID=CAMNT_0040163819 /DNA_START=61 /DNA_END=497 /DNA_ORIENTATION=+